MSLQRRRLCGWGAVGGAVYGSVWSVVYAAQGASGSLFVLTTIALGALFGAFAGGLGAVGTAAVESAIGSRRALTSIIAGLCAAVGFLPLVALAPFTGFTLFIAIGWIGATLAFLGTACFVWLRQTKVRQLAVDLGFVRDPREPSL